MAGTQRREQENGWVLNWEEGRGAHSWIWEQEKQMRWSGLSGAACFLHLSRTIFGILNAWFTCDLPHGALDIIGKDSRDFVSVFLSLFSQEHFLLSNQTKIN